MGLELSSVCVSVFPLTHSNMNTPENIGPIAIKILSEASLGWGKGCMKCLAKCDQNYGFHGNR